VQEEETNLIIRRETHTQRLSESNRIQKHITNWSMGFLGTRVSMPISPPHTQDQRAWYAERMPVFREYGSRSLKVGESKGLISACSQ
jgi:hypothetical protein